MKQKLFNFNLNSNQQNLFLNINHINLYQCTQEEEEFLSAHRYPKLMITIKGNGHMDIEGTSYPLSKKEVYFLNENCKINSISPEEKSLDFMVIGFNSVSFLSGNGENTLLIHHTISDLSTLFYVRKIREELLQQSSSYEAACNYYVNLFFILLRRNNLIDCELPDLNKSAQDCENIRSYIDTHFSENITLDTLALESKMNKYYLVHSFTNQYGCSPISYLNEKKIEESKKLLESSNYSIAEIAHLIGFSSQSYFSQSFKKHTFMTPNEYRQSTK